MEMWFAPRILARPPEGVAMGIRSRTLAVAAAGMLRATGELNTQSSRLKDVIESFLHEMTTT